MVWNMTTLILNRAIDYGFEFFEGGEQNPNLWIFTNIENYLTCEELGLKREALLFFGAVLKKEKVIEKKNYVIETHNLMNLSLNTVCYDPVEDHKLLAFEMLDLILMKTGEIGNLRECNSMQEHKELVNMI